MLIQRNTLVAPFSVNSPLMNPPPVIANVGQKNTRQASSSQPSGVVAVTHQKWFQSVANGINASVQISTTIPATSTSPGEPGTLVLFSGGFYLCVGSNAWLKFVGAMF